MSQFTREAPEHRTLADVFDFPRDVYPVGRLDKDSEGLLLLTNDTSINKRLLDPGQGHRRTYWVQVEGIPDEASLQKLREGVSFKVKGRVHQSAPAQAQKILPLPIIPERDPPVRFRKHIPTTWLVLELTEGKNRQVRRMCAAVGFPVLRLIRVAIGKLELGDLAQGEFRELTNFSEAFRQ